MWYREVFLAKTLAQRVKAQASPGIGQDFGKSLPELLARFDPDLRSWKIPQCSLLEDLELSLEIWPRWGMMRSGASYRQKMPALHTRESEYGFWPTATDHDAIGARGKNNTFSDHHYKPHDLVTRVLWPTPQAHKITESGEIVNSEGTPWNGIGKPHSKTTGRPITTALADAAKMWPTPAQRDYKGANSQEHLDKARGHHDQLPNFAKMMATPQSRDYRTGQAERFDNPDRSRNLNDQMGGKLSAIFVEWLMGWPQGWTDLKPSETGRYHNAQPSLGQS
jgi:hypothetical protein